MCDDLHCFTCSTAQLKALFSALNLRLVFLISDIGDQMSVVKLIALTSFNCVLLATMTLYGIMLAMQCLLVFSTARQILWLKVFDQAMKAKLLSNM